MRGLIRLLSLISLSGSLVLSESSHTPNSPGEPDAGASLNQLVEEVFSIKQSVCRNCLIAIGEFSDAGGNTENVRMTNVIRQMLVRDYFLPLSYTLYMVEEGLFSVHFKSLLSQTLKLKRLFLTSPSTHC